jgi:hypothetical protein
LKGPDLSVQVAAQWTTVRGMLDLREQAESGSGTPCNIISWTESTPLNLARADMTNLPTTSLPPGQAARLAVLLDALNGVALADGERASLVWLVGFEAHTVENIAEVISRCPTDPVAEVSDLPTAMILPKVAPDCGFPAIGERVFPGCLH